MAVSEIISNNGNNIETIDCPKWQLRGVKIEKSKVTPIPLTPEQAEITSDYLEALKVASESNIPNPIYSKYFVGEAIGPLGIKKIPAGNIEYGYRQALHGEESAVSSFRLNYPNFKGRVILGIVTIKQELDAPCGNCRDILFDFMEGEPEKLDIVYGPKQGGTAFVATLKDYLFEDYKLIHDGGRSFPFKKQVKIIRDLEKSGIYDTNPSEDNPYPERNYTAAIKTRNRLYIGGHSVDDDYHPVYPLENVIVQAKGDISMESVIIISSNEKGLPPKVMYRDRQRLLRHNQRRIDVGESNPNLPIYLINDRDLKNLKIWATNIEEWLPIPSASNRLAYLRKLAF